MYIYVDIGKMPVFQPPSFYDSIERVPVCVDRVSSSTQRCDVSWKGLSQKVFTCETTETGTHL